MEPNSPFSKTNIQPFGEFSRQGSHVGFLLPDGRILVNFSDNTHQSVLSQIAQTIGAELIVVSGTWTFKPDDTTTFKKVARRKS